MDLSMLRQQIDGIDEQIINLINERYTLVQEVGKWKEKQQHEIYVPEREKALLLRLEKLNKGVLPNNTLRAIYREIMSGALALEYPLKVAYLGPENTFSHQAAITKFGNSITYAAKNSIAEVFNSIEKNKETYGVVPIENSTEGAVTYTLDIFMQSSCKICAELHLQAHHYLMSLSKKEDIKLIYSHPQALGQCKNYLYKNFGQIKLIEVQSTAEAARRAASEENSAAIASNLAAQFYKLNIIDEKIEDQNKNITRFLVISNQKTKATGEDKTSLLFVVNDKVGALYRCLEIFDKHNINMTMIESRPLQNKEQKYAFFVDFLGHQEEDNIKQVLQELKQYCTDLKILGSYPYNKES